MSKESSMIYRLEHLDEYKEYQKEYHKKYDKIYKAKNKEKYKEYEKKRRKKLQINNKVLNELENFIIEEEKTNNNLILSKLTSESSKVKLGIENYIYDDILNKIQELKEKYK